MNGTIQVNGHAVFLLAIGSGWVGGILADSGVLPCRALRETYTECDLTGSLNRTFTGP